MRDALFRGNTPGGIGGWEGCLGKGGGVQTCLGVEGSESECLVLESDGPSGGGAGMQDGRRGDGNEQHAQGQGSEDFQKGEGGIGRNWMAGFPEMAGGGVLHGGGL